MSTAAVVSRIAAVVVLLSVLNTVSAFSLLPLFPLLTPFSFHPLPFPSHPLYASRLQRLQCVSISSVEASLSSTNSLFDWDDNNTDAMSAKLDALKKAGKIKKWRCANFDPLKISSRELYLATRNDFTTGNQFNFATLPRLCLVSNC
jgi:hypothetical protein